MLIFPETFTNDDPSSATTGFNVMFRFVTYQCWGDYCKPYEEQNAD